MIEVLENPEKIASAFKGTRLLNCEFLFASRPHTPQRGAIFDLTFHSRQQQLTAQDGVLLIATDQASIDSVTPLLERYSQVRQIACITNPTVSDEQPQTPFELVWDMPAQWRKMRCSDRWARLLYAFEVGKYLHQQGDVGWLVFPAWDARWGDQLLPLLMAYSHQCALQSIPAAVSPYSAFQDTKPLNLHKSRLGANLYNLIFARDRTFREGLKTGDIQGFWGKMGLIPYALCEFLLQHVDTDEWEDDLEIDRALTAGGWASRGLWIADERQYRHVLPIFHLDDVYQIVTRHLHYSLRLATQGKNRSHLLDVPDRMARRRTRWSRLQARIVPTAQTILATADETLMTRVKHDGASWVDWGAYRYVTRPSVPQVEVWKRSR